jgi:nuclear pore complex protein Nup107
LDHINPLRDMADRVGREVDHFAETLDKFNDRLHGQNAYRAAYDLTLGYKQFASGMLHKLKKRHDAQRVNEMKSDFGKRITQSPIRSSSLSGPVGPVTHNDGDDDMPAQTSLDTLKQWQAELDTWELFRIMLDLRYSPDNQSRQKENEATLEQLPTPNTYTSDADIWERFTLHNDSARERHLVLKWLQGAANHGESDIEAIADELEKKSGRGSGVWINGWMETRERIKGTKRMRVYSIASSDTLDVKRTHSNEPLVSSLDPDAPTRQHRVLEKADEYSERALWMTCWEMLRRGHAWSDICQWCVERNQSWRAVSMAASPESNLNVGLPGASSGSLWRRMCYSLVQEGGSDEYEAAVYGVLSGDLDSVKRICQSWDDHVFAHYNSLLIGQLEEYLQKTFPEKYSSGLATKFPLFDSLRRHGDQADVARNLIRQLNEQPSTSQEAQSPLKMLQASLIANTLPELCQNLAMAISDAAWYQTTSTVIAPLRTAISPDSQRESAIFNDYDALRIVTHMVLMLRQFYKPMSPSNSDPEALDNILAAYIQLLRAAGKWELTPLYASRMSSARGTKSLAQTMTDVQDIQEKMRFNKLMSLYGIDSVAVLVAQAKYLMEEVLPEKSTEHVNIKIIESTDEDLYPGQRIKLDFVADGKGGEGIADHLAVFYLMEGNWDVSFETLAYACRKLLRKSLHCLFISLMLTCLLLQLAAASKKHLVLLIVSPSSPCQ